MTQRLIDIFMFVWLVALIIFTIWGGIEKGFSFYSIMAILLCGMGALVFLSYARKK